MSPAVGAWSSGPLTAAFAPGRVNLIGDHTDYTGGLALPMAIDLGTTVSGARGGPVVELVSDQEPEAARVPLTIEDPSTVTPGWARYVAGVVAEVRPPEGLVGEVRTTLPVGAGLSSSAALELAVALALGFDGGPEALARSCQRAEQAASGVPCGIMDQLSSAAGVAGHALLMDFATAAVTPVPVPDELVVWVVHSGQERQLAGSAYAERRACCEAAASVLGPLHRLRPDDLDRLDALTDPVARRRARHVITENDRVRQVAAALRDGEHATAGRLMDDSHRSLRDDFEVSTPALEATVAHLRAQRGVLGARLTGAGFGGCVVALVEAGTRPDPGPRRAWRVRPAQGARRLTG